VRGPLLAIDPRRPAPTQRAGGLERGDPSVAHRHHRRLHQQPARLPGVLYQLAALGLTVPIMVVLDNARYPRCGLAQQTAAHLRIELLFLPAYSPQFNLIERFWKLVKKCCLHARYSPTFPDFKKSILHFIETAHVDKKDLLKS